MGAVTYFDGIAILQLFFFPVFLACGIYIWSRVGWRVGAKTWRFVVTLSLIRIAGSICSLLTINHDSRNVEIAEAVCQLIGLAPLLLTYVGLLRQIALRVMSLVVFIGLILGIAGISSADDSSGFTPTGITQAAMGIFVAAFVIICLVSAYLATELRSSLNSAQKKLFLAIGLSIPFVLVRVVYSAIADFGKVHSFTVLVGNPTIYLCMDVLEEIIAMGLCVGFGVSALQDQPKSYARDTDSSSMEFGKV
ncbi:uncharacterized protein N7459_008935 [Penicillium hispanicum]|uniref:uncharacterized protein n=1 Tax=Penicillium hispanicum TaxID=1080232 RepID=UPI00253FE467|nr:uncharacterized protein N7459_008935 [Penicillium hispanicum]KAJ5569505.1 hypothetical protein N7459_008935 [Penicillium hispanicum]